MRIGITKGTKANYSVKKGFFYLTINLDYSGSSGPCSLYNPVYFNRRVYDVGFPLVIPEISTTFLQEPYQGRDSYYYGKSQNYFLFSPWYVESMSTICGSNNESSFAPYEIKLRNNKSQSLSVKSWGNYVIYKQSPTDKRTPGKPNVLFAEKNSVITYAMQHKALFTQRCLYVLKFKEVKAGDYIGLKRQANTGEGFDMVIWWSVDGDGKAPTNVTAKEFREVKATKNMTPEELADMIASEINGKGTTIFNVPTITDKEYDYYIRY